MTLLGPTGVGSRRAVRATQVDGRSDSRLLGGFHGADRGSGVHSAAGAAAAPQPLRGGFSRVSGLSSTFIPTGSYCFLGTAITDWRCVFVCTPITMEVSLLPRNDQETQQILLFALDHHTLVLLLRPWFCVRPPFSSPTADVRMTELAHTHSLRRKPEIFNQLSSSMTNFDQS